MLMNGYKAFWGLQSVSCVQIRKSRVMTQRPARRRSQGRVERGRSHG